MAIPPVSSRRKAPRCPVLDPHRPDQRSPAHRAHYHRTPQPGASSCPRR